MFLQIVGLTSLRFQRGKSHCLAKAGAAPEHACSSKMPGSLLTHIYIFKVTPLQLRYIVCLFVEVQLTSKAPSFLFNRTSRLPTDRQVLTPMLSAESPIQLQLIDKDGAMSEPFTLTAVVRPMNTLAPVTTRNTGLQLFEGQSRPLLAFQNLEIADENNIEDVRITVLDGLRHGKLNIIGLNGRSYFTPDDLDAGKVTYKHDDSDSNSDNIIFLLTDGENDVEFLFPITIYPVDDEPPILKVNTGVEIKKNAGVQITPSVLSATDVDSDDDAIVYTVVGPHFSERGFIIKRQHERPADAGNWERAEDYYQQPVKEWIQKDIMDGKIFYINTAEAMTDVILDKWNFTLRDNHDPPNESGVKQFVVKIYPVDEFAPYPDEDADFHMAVYESEATPITRRHLRYKDDDSNERELKYVITDGPKDSDVHSPFEGGTLVFCDDEETEVSSFNQAQIFHHKICYKPTGMELGIAPRVIQFGYRVEDPAGNSRKEGEFTIYLKPVDNQPPRVRNTGFTVLENGKFVLSTSMLQAEDPDTDIEKIIFRVTALPEHGILWYSGREMTIGQDFTQRDIASGRITYENTGEEMERDSIKLDVTDGIHHVPTTFKITVEPIDDELPLLLIPGTVGAVIDVPEHGSTPLMTAHLRASDPDTNDLMLTYILETAPTEGMVLRSGEAISSFTQGDIRNGFVEYKHMRGEIGLLEKSDAFNLTLTDNSDDWIIGGNRITGVNVQVRILPVDNEKPQVVVGGIFEVGEGKKKTILAQHIEATDADTDDNTLICTIVTAPTYGYLENTSPASGSEKSREGTPISAFHIKDIRDNNINYVQSIHQGIEPTEDRFIFQCSDGVNESPTYIFSIVIRPSNDEKPELFTREFVVEEGDSLSLDPPIINAVDKDEPANDLAFSILSKPEHGRIVRQELEGTSEIRGFTLKDIERGRVLYEHDDTETLKDGFKLKLTDGENDVVKEIPIMIISVDDETPRLSVNNGLDVERGQTTTVTSDDLASTDLDSEDANITFTVSRVPSYGFLQRKTGDHIANFTRGMAFQQWEIQAGNIQYTHTGREGVRDLIKFDVTDGINPLIDRYFYVNIDGIDNIYPEVLNKGVQLPERGSIILSTNLLSTTDSNSPDENLEFSVTRKPTKGHLERTDNPGVPIRRFTQLDLAGNKIRYVHTSHDEVKLDSFEFEVTDGYNPVFRTFRISLSDVDNQKPVLMLETLRVREGGSKLITPFEIRANDEDTDDHRIKFHITQPSHGKIQYNNSRTVNSFTMRDLNQNLLTYHHDGSETSEDSFSITVTDGTHYDFYVFPDMAYTTRRSQKVPVKIISVDNGFPRIEKNTGASYLESLEDGGTGFHFSSKHLKAVDRDSPEDTLMYDITEPPKYGYIIHSDTGNNSVSNWTQGKKDSSFFYEVKLQKGAC